MAAPTSIGFEMQNVEAYNEVTPQPQESVDRDVELGKGDNGIDHAAPQSKGFEETKDGLADSAGTSTKESLGKRSSLYFQDGVRHIDYILGYIEFENEDRRLNRKGKRDIFEENLRREGLEMEHIDSKIDETVDKKTNFVKIHAPWKTLTRFAEILKIKMPIQANDLDLETKSIWKTFCGYCPNVFTLSDAIIPDEPAFFTAAFNRERFDQYIMDSKEEFFTPSQRSRIVYWIMTKTIYTLPSDEKPRFGVRKLLSNGTYSAAFPLHEGDFESEHSIYAHGADNERHLLYETWARPKMWYKNQPLDLIRKYYGEKIGIYFTWLGYYTQMLIPAAVVGLIAFLYSVITLFDDVKGNEICEMNKSGSYIMCPLCDEACSWWYLQSSCTYARITYLFDNSATVAFAAFMALWATFFHEYWKRKEAFIRYDWDVADFEEEEEQVRPEFEASVKSTKLNPINDCHEPFLPPWSRCMRYFTALTVILFMLLLVIAAVFGVILYRMSIVTVFYAYGEPIIEARAKILTTITAACINLIIILLLNLLYTYVAKYLTNLEQHRTETEWEDSFTLKMFLFQFVNYYGSIFYIAFFKGRFVGRPGDYNYTLFNNRQEECDPAGCLIELCIQLAIIMVGKQTFNNFKEVIFPKIIVWFKSRKIKEVEEEKGDIDVPQWEEDYVLVDMPKFGLFDDYLEMVVQFGFVTIFVAAFPLAPMFALLNNIIEIRLDAYKFVTQWRRPLAVRAEDIGIWFGILRGVTAIAVLSNAFIVAFTSDFLPKLYYQSIHSPDGSLTGFVNFSLAHFHVDDFQTKSIPNNLKVDIFGNVSFCRYRAFMEYPGYNYTRDYWLIFTIRLAFVIVFQNVIVVLTLLISYLVPDIPYTVKIQMLREKHLADQAIITAIKKKN